MADISRERELVAAAPRAGFWRRATALAIDGFLVIAAFQIAVMMLFPISGGRVQMDLGLLWMDCRPTLEPVPGAPTLQAGIFVIHCRSSVGGLMTANVMRTVRLIASDEAARTEGRTYRLNAKGEAVNGFAVDWLVDATLLVYLVERQTRAGRTLGQRLMKCRVADATTGRNPSLWRTILRNLFIAIGFVPGMVWPVVAGALTDGLFPPTFAKIAVWAAPLLVLLGWYAVNIVLIAHKRDPFYDRWAGTAVLRDARPLTAPG